MDEDAFVEFLEKRGNTLEKALTIASVLSASFLIREAEALGDSLSEETARQMAGELRRQLAVTLAIGDTGALPFEDSDVPKD